MDDDVENDDPGWKNTIIIKSVVYIVKHFRQTKKTQKSTLCSS